jgi:hypothetical protein
LPAEENPTSVHEIVNVPLVPVLEIFAPISIAGLTRAGLLAAATFVTVKVPMVPLHVIVPAGRITADPAGAVHPVGQFVVMLPPPSIVTVLVPSDN